MHSSNWTSWEQFWQVKEVICVDDEKSRRELDAIISIRSWSSNYQTSVSLDGTFLWRPLINMCFGHGRVHWLKTPPVEHVANWGLCIYNRSLHNTLHRNRSTVKLPTYTAWWANKLPERLPYCIGQKRRIGPVSQKNNWDNLRKKVDNPEQFVRPQIK